MAKTIMVVDDDIGDLELVETILKPKYNVIKAGNGKECLEKLKTTKPDLMLIDFFMPEMTGRELLDLIKADENLREIKIMFLTIKRFTQKEMDELKEIGVLDYIPKPFDVKDFIKRIEAVI